MFMRTFWCWRLNNGINQRWDCILKKYLFVYTHLQNLSTTWSWPNNATRWFCFGRRDNGDCFDNHPGRNWSSVLNQWILAWISSNCIYFKITYKSKPSQFVSKWLRFICAADIRFRWDWYQRWTHFSGIYARCLRLLLFHRFTFLSSYQFPCFLQACLPCHTVRVNRCCRSNHCWYPQRRGRCKFRWK